MGTELKLKGKKIDELISNGILPKRDTEIPMPGTPEREVFEEVIRNTDAFTKYFSLLTKVELKGTEKQVAWAAKIREGKAKSAAFEMVMNLIYSKIAPKFGIDFNKYANRIVKEFTASNSAWWIEHR